MRRPRIALAVAVLSLLGGAGAAHAATFADGDGLHVTNVKQLDPRLVEVTVTTPALPGPAAVRILLPPNYDANSTTSYPVFYLLHGTSGGANDWTDLGDAEKTVGDRPMIVVMPDIALNRDGGGWCTNWPNGAYSWERFHIDQLVPWIDDNLRTIRDRDGRAIAGLSQGGFCSLSYAARHPDLFSIALGYSGAPDIWNDPGARAGAMTIIGGTEMGLDRVPPGTFFGDPLTDGINWAAHDPATLAENLRWTRMYMYWGNGFPGPLDPNPGNGGSNLIEGAVNYDNQFFQQRLNALGIPAYFDAYGNGTHSWPYWARDLRESIDKIQSDFDHPQGDPAQFTYSSADATYAVYGWSVATHRAVREFSTLNDQGADRFSLSGSGSATVQTPARYTPGATYAVTLAGDQAAASTVSAVADPAGRLEIEVPLGPDNAVQQDTVPTDPTTAVHTTVVTIAAQ